MRPSPSQCHLLLPHPIPTSHVWASTPNEHLDPPKPSSFLRYLNLLLNSWVTPNPHPWLTYPRLHVISRRPPPTLPLSSPPSRKLPSPPPLLHESSTAAPGFVLCLSLISRASFRFYLLTCQVKGDPAGL